MAKNSKGHPRLHAAVFERDGKRFVHLYGDGVDETPLAKIKEGYQNGGCSFVISIPLGHKGLDPLWLMLLQLNDLSHGRIKKLLEQLLDRAIQGGQDIEKKKS